MRKNRLFAALVLTFGIALTNCSDDEEVPEEPFKTQPEEVPATPPPSDAGAVSQDEISQTVVYFAFDEYTLTPTAQDALNKLSDFMKASSSAVVQIEGHCDERGSIEYNLALGERRAQSVKNYLVQLGIDPARLPTISYGEEKPISSGSGESAWSQNRRAAFVVSTP